jgi:hypothetical protein
MTHDHTTTPLELVPPLDCAAFEHHLGDYLEGDLPPAQRTAAEAHRAGCAACARLVAELDGLRDAAAALPMLHPSRDLWEGVAARIAAPVVPIAVDTPRRSGARGNWLRQPWMAAAAALLLVGSTAALTYTLASRAPLGGPSASAPGVAAAPAVAGPERAAPVAPLPTPAPASPADAAPAMPGATPDAVPGPARTRTAPAPASTRLAANAGPASPYDAEISQLRAVLEQRRAGLDTGTVRVVERNLAIIEQAIRESRAALARDPSSQFLSQQLNAMLGDKLELMRTAVLLSGDD